LKRVRFSGFTKNDNFEEKNVKDGAKQNDEQTITDKHLYNFGGERLFILRMPC
jgi:hypothetical protein